MTESKMRIIEGIEKILLEESKRVDLPKLTSKVESLLESVGEKHSHFCKCHTEEEPDPQCPSASKWRSCCECNWNDGTTTYQCGPWHCE